LTAAGRRKAAVLNNLGWGELMMLGLLGLMIFGPDQLPKIAADLGRMVRQLREVARDASTDLRNELGPEFDDVDLASLSPRRFIEKHMLGDDEPERAPKPRTAPVPPEPASAVPAEPAVGQATAADRPAEALAAPYDADAT
jgi:sec-independent protein translocase protein TatB